MSVFLASNGLQYMAVMMGLLMLMMGGVKLSALSANADVDRYIDQDVRSYPVASGEHIYRSGWVGTTPAGYLKPFEPGDLFAGLAYEEADNSSGSDGTIECRVYTIGDFEVTLASVDARHTGRAVYATADDAVAMTGHPDAFIGRVVRKVATNKALVRLRAAGERPSAGEGSIDLSITGHENFAATGAAAGTTSVGGFDLKSILGTGWVCNDGEDGGIKGDFDATAEVALCSLRTRNDCLPIDKGLTMDFDLCVADKGDDAALDIDAGFGTALTTNSEADIDHADMVQLACIHMDGNSDNVLFQSDDNTTDVAAVDTTVDNDSTTDTFKHYKIVVRPSGAVELWVDGVRKLATTNFTMLSTANVGAFVNMEKGNNDTTASIIVRNLRVAAGMAA